MTDYYPLTNKQLHTIEPGDVIERMLAFSVPHYLVVPKYTFESDACVGVPKGSKVALIDHINDQFAMIYNGMWFGYYDFSSFKPILR